MPRRNTPGDFWRRVACRGYDECWPWQGPVTDRGYGKTHYGGKERRAHQVAFFLANGFWAAPFTLHSCDNPPCCNPGHLREGTHADNMAEMAARDRAWKPKNEAHPACKLTDAQVREIRALAGTMTHAAIARLYGVHPLTPGQIIRGERRRV